MVQVISTARWEQWCKRVSLDVQQARFASHTCYLGRGLRTRPGTLVVTDAEVIHHSYSWRETLYALFEPSVRVTIPLDAIESVRIGRIGFWESTAYGRPQAFIQLRAKNGEAFSLFLYRSAPEFLEVLAEAGLDPGEPKNAGSEAP